MPVLTMGQTNQVSLTVNTAYQLTVQTAGHSNFFVLNSGPGNLYVKYGGAPSAGDPNSVKLPTGMTVFTLFPVDGYQGLWVLADQTGAASVVVLPNPLPATGLSLTTGGSGQPQTPWASDINGANHKLTNVNAVGIGTTTPTGACHVAGGIFVGGALAGLWPPPTGLVIYDEGGRMILWSRNNSGADYPMEIEASDLRMTLGPVTMNAGNFTLNSAGVADFETAVGVRKANPTHDLELYNDSAAKPTTNTWTIFSDARLKRNVKTLKGGLSIIEQIRPVEAEYNGLGDTPAGARVVSVVAEDLRKVLPHCVSSHRGKLRSEDAEDSEILDFNSHEILFHLILAVQQMSEQIKALTKKS